MVRDRIHWEQPYSLHKDITKLLMPIPNNFMDYAHKFGAVRLLPLDKQLLLKKCVLMQKKKKKKKLFTIKLHDTGEITRFILNVFTFMEINNF